MPCTTPVKKTIALLLLVLLADTLHAATLAVIGTGRVGGALGPRLAELGLTVIYGSRNPDSEQVRELISRSPGASATSPSQAVAAAQIILLAIPWRAAKSVVQDFDAIEGKIVIDVTNALTMADDGLMTMAVDTSAGELLQQWMPTSHVVKAFNAVGYRVMADPAVAGGPVTIPIAGNNPDAKMLVGNLIVKLGFGVIDLGPLRNARHLEGMAVLYMVPYLTGRHDEVFEFHFRQSDSLRSNRAVRPAQ